MVVGPALECKGVNYVNRDPKAASVSGGRGVASGDQRGGWEPSRPGEGEDTECTVVSWNPSMLTVEE